MRQCFIYFTRSLNRGRAATVRKIRSDLSEIADVYVLSYVESTPSSDSGLQQTFDVGVPHQVITRAMLSQFAASFSCKYSDNDDWRIMPGNLDLAHLAFFKKLPAYDHYWFCEDDVRYTGRYAKLLDRFSLDTADLIATNWRYAPPVWAHLASFNTPPGEQLPEVPAICFLPFFRASNRMLNAVVNAYSNGLCGHHEVTWPHVVKSCGFIGRDFNCYGRRLYTSSLADNRMAPGTFVCRPSRLFAGVRINTLYHPVKPGLQAVEEKILAWIARMNISSPRRRYVIQRIFTQIRRLRRT